MCLLGSICASITGIFVKIQMWHLHTSNMLALNFCHIVTKFTICVTLLLQLCVCVCMCTHTHTHTFIYLFVWVCVSTVFGLWDVLIKSSYYVTLGFFFKSSGCCLYSCGELRKFCVCVCVCVHTHTHTHTFIYLFVWVCVSTVFGLWDVLIKSSYHVTLGFYFKSSGRCLYSCGELRKFVIQ